MIIGNRFHWRGKSSTLKQGLVSCWDFEETSGKIVYDSFGTNNGSLSNVTVNQKGKIGKCYLYSHSSISRILIPASSSFDNSGSISINVWAYNSQVADTRCLFFISSSPYSLSGPGVYLMYGGDNQMQVSFRSSNNELATTFNAGPFSFNAWLMYTLTIEKIYDGGNKARIRFYVNGSLSSTTDVSLSNDTWNLNVLSAFTIGAMNFSYALTGLIDQFAFWKRVLTQEEIMKLYNFGDGLTFQNW